MAYRRSSSTLAFDHPGQQIAFQDYVVAVITRNGACSRSRNSYSAAPGMEPAPVVDALQAMRGIALMNAVVLVADVGDFVCDVLRAPFGRRGDFGAMEGFDIWRFQSLRLSRVRRSRCAGWRCSPALVGDEIGPA